MALNFSVGDRVRVDFTYVLDPASGLPSKTVQLLQTLGSGIATIREIGYIKVEDQLTSRPLPIRIFPVDTRNPLFQHGQGTVVYFKSETQINNSFTRV